MVLQNEVLMKLINENDTTNLERVLNTSREISGYNNTDLSLMLAYCGCNRLDEARAIAENRRLHDNPQKILSVCETCAKLGQPQRLERLLDATEYSNAINRTVIFEHLLDFYWKNDSLDDILALWRRIEKESFVVNEQFLTKLGTYLQRKRILVPFNIPKGN